MFRNDLIKYVYSAEVIIRWKCDGDRKRKDHVYVKGEHQSTLQKKIKHYLRREIR